VLKDKQLSAHQRLKKSSIFIFKLTLTQVQYERATGIVWTDDHRLFQESNLTMQQPCKSPIMSCIWFNKVNRRSSQSYRVVEIDISSSALHAFNSKY